MRKKTTTINLPATQANDIDAAVASGRTQAGSRDAFCRMWAEIGLLLNGLARLPPQGGPNSLDLQDIIALLEAAASGRHSPAS